jgi:Family of unknown function (DUF6176)
VETLCVRVRLEPGSLPRVREWAAELNARRDEVMATLQDEGVRIESVFLESETLVYFLKVDSIDHAREAYSRSRHAIDAYHQRFKDETFAEQTQLELLIDFENL